MKPVSNICASIYEAKSHAVIGVSPFNSYFSEERLTALFAWANQKFDTFHVFVPDEATRYTLEAAGYEAPRAKKKARRQAKYLLNKINRALDKTIPNFAPSIVLTNSDLRKNEQYMALLARVEERFAFNVKFRKQCLECTRWVMESQVENIDQLDEDSLLHAVRYFLEEMPLFMDSASIVGASSSMFCYHQCPAILRGLYEDRSDDIMAQHQGFLVIDEAKLVVQAA